MRLWSQQRADRTALWPRLLPDGDYHGAAAEASEAAFAGKVKDELMAALWGAGRASSPGIPAVADGPALRAG
jgi:hypothetical protein